MNSAARAFGTLVGIALTAGFIAAGPSGGAGTAVAPGPSRTPDQGSVLPDQIEPGTETTVVHGPDVSGPAKDTVQRGQPAENPATAAAMCAAGRNTGPSAPGVTANKIRLASTAVLDGPAASLLSSSPTAMQAVINKVNRAGGVCGRQLELTVVNDGFNAQRGSDFIRNFIDEKYFALPVVPSAEGLSAAIAAKSISRAGIPVVGTDGMRLEQYDEPWVWPVATATASTMRIMARYGYEKVGARTFAIVWDDKYQFGIEGADAFRAEVQRLGGTVVAPIRLNPDLPSYGSDADNFNHLCANGKCDMVALLLLPDTARAWMAAHPQAAGKYTAAAQTLFSDRFAQQCVQVADQSCNGINVWTGYNPPIGSLEASPGMVAYENDVRSVDPRIDVRNQFVEGAYLGMSLFVEALRKVGPNLTRDALRQQLDQMTMESDLAPPLAWKPGQHHANGRARAFSMVVSQGTFTGWRDEQTGFVLDPLLEGKK